MKKLIFVFLFMFVVLQVPAYAEDKVNDEVTDQLKVKGAEFLTWLMDTIKQTKDVVVKEAPEVVRQLLTYEAIDCWTLIIGFVLATTILLGWFFVGNYLNRKNGKTLNDENPLSISAIICLVFGIIGILISIPVCIVQFGTIMQIHYAPYAYLIHQFAIK